MTNLNNDMFIAMLLDCGTADLVILEDMNEDLLMDTVESIREHGNDFDESGVTLGGIWLTAYYNTLNTIENTLAEYDIDIILDEHVEYFFNFLDTHIYINYEDQFKEELKEKIESISTNKQEEMLENLTVRTEEELFLYITNEITKYMGIIVAG